ncbi:uncharacterized protein LOC143273982 isoform X1 [Peromyscus maniculatus bairdii]|uniref:uncharacterized protein LOC143273982 isoform X1 n=1 Tax=Peromyscus maniculatus bairdii TaxID=230844 RepID=UPI003FD41456
MKKMARGRRHPWAPSHPAPSVTAPPPTAPEGPAAPTAAPKQRRMRFLLSPQLPVAYEEGGTNQRSSGPAAPRSNGVQTSCLPQPRNPAAWFTDESSFLQEGERRAGAAVTTESEIVWTSPLPPGTSAQKAELIALTQALRMMKARRTRN